MRQGRSLPDKIGTGRSTRDARSGRASLTDARRDCRSRWLVSSSYKSVAWPALTVNKYYDIDIIRTEREGAENEEVRDLKLEVRRGIDLTDMPEVLDWSKAEIGKFYRPAKKPVTIRLDTDIIAWLKSYGRGYQTKTNILLRHAMRSSVRAKANRKQLT